MRISGPSRKELDAVGDEFEALVTTGIKQALAVLRKDLSNTTTVDDLGVIRRVFTQYTDDTLMPYLEKQWHGAADAQRERLVEAVLTAAFVPPPLPGDLAENYLLTASNRLKGISDEVWEHTRTTLTEGMTAGESIPQLRKRVQAVAGVAAPRATMIARTEVIGAQNRGSLEMMKAANTPATKTWLATNDHRTRETHRNANGQTVPLTDKFSVGATSMDGPHDPFGPPGETINCRCTLTYDMPDDALAPEGLTGQDAFDSLPVPTMTDLERYGFDAYRGGRYTQINQPLRNGQAPSELVGSLPEIINSLDAVIGRSAMPETIRVQRGVRDISSFIGDLKVGTVVKDNAFMSTTVNSDIVRSFADGRGGTVWDITVPKGTHGVPVPDSSEGEILLARGLELRIDAVEVTETTLSGAPRNYLIKATVV